MGAAIGGRRNGMGEQRHPRNHRSSLIRFGGISGRDDEGLGVTLVDDLLLQRTANGGAFWFGWRWGLAGGEGLGYNLWGKFRPVSGAITTNATIILDVILDSGV